MRFTFCFSRSCCPYPASILRRAAPCCAGCLVPRFSIAHEGLKQRSPFKNNFPPSRRHRRHTASLYLAIVFLPSAKMISHFGFAILDFVQSRAHTTSYFHSWAKVYRKHIVSLRPLDNRIEAFSSIQNPKSKNRQTRLRFGGR